LPDRDDEHPRYDIPLSDLTGRHGYALQRGEDDEPIDPGAPVAYVAEPLKPRQNMLTIEGMIAGIGDMAAGAAKEGGAPAWGMRTILAVFALPIVVTVVATLVHRF
jgi:hypothetical protein